MQPLCEDFLKPEDLHQMEPHYPLRVYVCENCFLVQVEDVVRPEVIYRDYAYFASYSATWIEHSRKYAEMAIKKFNLSSGNFVLEVASNDGYLLQFFKEKNIKVLGIDPSRKVAEQAIKQKGINTEILFLNEKNARLIKDKYQQADLVIGNNVLAHVPDINDFVRGLKILLKPEGVLTMEFPHLMHLIERNEFDTIYHEHYSYLSLSTVCEIFSHHEMLVWDVEELPTHGGSLRIYVSHGSNNKVSIQPDVFRIIEKEIDLGFHKLSFYNDFSYRIARLKTEILGFFIQAKRNKKQVVGYGAPGKGNTLLNYCGIQADMMDYTVDLNPFKHNRYLPGSLIPVYDPKRIKLTRPDYIFILPWNLKHEIMKQLTYIGEWGGKFVIPVPSVKIQNARKLSRDKEFSVR